MNKQEFLERLTAALSGLPQEEIRKTVEYYSEIIDDAVEDGKEEYEIISGFDSVEEIAERVINETPIRKFVTEDVKKRNISVGAVVLIIIGAPVWLPVLVGVFSILVSMYITVWSVVISLFSIFAAFAFTAVAMIILAPIMAFARPVKAILAFGLALLFAGLSVFMFYISVWSAKLIIRFTIFLARQIKNAFIRKGSAER